MLYWGGTIIKTIRGLLIILLIIFFTFSAFSQDTTSDKDKKYLEELRSYVNADEKAETPQIQEQSSQEDNGQFRVKTGIVDYLKIIFTLAIVIGIIYLLYYILKKTLKIKNNLGDDGIVVSSQSLGPGKWIQIVFVGGKYLVLGITNDNVNYLTEIVDPKEIERLEISVNEQKSREGKHFVDVITDFFVAKLNKKSDKEKFDYEKDSVNFFESQKDRLKRFKNKE